MKIIENKLRAGRFTSSRISELLTVAKDKVSFGKPALSYIEEKNIEIRLGRSIGQDSNSRPTSWGNLVERRVFDLLGIEYKLCSDVTISHQDYPDIWAGSPDMIKYDEGQTVVDIKCPFTLKSFCKMADCTDIQQVRKSHDSGDDYYWQLVSNATINKSRFAELVIYCPYLSELPDIRELAANYDGNQNKVAWVGWAEDDELPYLPDGGYYNNIYTFRFEVSEEDKALLTQAVVKAGKELQIFK